MSNFFQRLFIGTGTEFAGIELDAVLVEQFDVSAEITDHPVDIGSVVSDHAYINPESYILEGVVSDAPMSVLGAARQIGDNALNLLNSGFVNTTGSILSALADPPPASKRSVAAYLSLLEVWRNLTVFNVQTAMGLKENLMIQNMTARVDNETANMLRFTAILRQVPRIDTAIVATDNLLDGPVSESAGALVAEGVKQSVASTADTIARVTSFFS